MSGRVVGLDLGSRRIGVAVSDPGRVLASPRATIERDRARVDDHRRIAEVVAEAGATTVVVGLPLSLDGSRGQAALDVEVEVDELRAVLTVPVVVHDERLTTVAATRGQRARGVRAREGRRTVDQQAAAVLLQSWLDGQAVGDA
jgi:putative Holliday junction resolvase